VGRFTEEWKSMSYKNFGLQVMIRLLLLTVGILGSLHFSYVFVNYIRLFFACLFTLIVLIEFFYFIFKTNRDTRQFLEAIIHNDFTQKYSAEQKGRSFGKLYATFNQVNEKFLQVSQQEASEYQYIKMLIQQLKIGVLSYDQKDRIHLANDSLKEMLSKDELINLESIQKVSPALFNLIKDLKTNQNIVEKVSINGKEYHLSAGVAEFKLRTAHYRLVWLQDIRGTLDKNEMEAWQKLIRVLTHEIMNSVAPITSLSSTLNQMVALSQKSKTALRPEELVSLHDGLDAIENRSAGLMNFTEAYRSLTRIPLPNIQSVNGRQYFHRINSLFQSTLSGTNIHFEMTLPEGDFTLNIDPNLMEQAIINLLKNAKEAVLENGGKTIHLTVEQIDSSHTLVTIEDDGGGIPVEIEESIFIPFYTTKNTGSGIGLSLVKQIVHAHHGEIDFSINRLQGSTKFMLRLDSR
jgi:two-component system, NtrC family, nitrogen regulation sensor histidine kinase NtrY